MKKQSLMILSVFVLGLSGLAKAETPPAVSPPARSASSQQPQQSTSATGKITAYTAGAHGELDGFILDSGTTVHFPVHTGFKVKPLLQKGQALSIDGTLQPGIAGQVLEASTIKNMVSGQSVTIASISSSEGLPLGAVSPPGMPALSEGSNS